MQRCGVVLLAVVAAAFPSVAARAGASDISVDDLVRFAMIGDPGTLEWDEEMTVREPAVYSPDGSLAAVVVRRGNPQQGTNDGTLLVYRTKDLLRGIAPTVIAEFASRTNYQPIALVRWLSSGDSLVFAATDGARRSAIYRADVRTKTLVQLTSDIPQPIWYDTTPSGDRLVIAGERAKSRPADDPGCRARGCLVTADAFWDAEDGILDGSAPLAVYDTAARATKVLPDPEATHPELDACYHLPGGISPDGRFVLRVCTVRDWKSFWSEYTINPYFRSCYERKNLACLQSLLLIDLNTGASAPVSDAPFALQAEPIWIDGGRSFIVPGAMESLTGVHGDERVVRKANLAALLFDASTLQSRRIARLDPRAVEVSSASWDEREQTLVLESADVNAGPLPQARYRRQGVKWIAGTSGGRSAADATRRARLVVRESLNERPRLFAVDAESGREAQILDPNPWLAERRLGRAEAITWKDKDDRTWHGGLYYPSEYVSGQRYPLVIQTHGFQPELFSLDGRARNFAGRALTAHGIAVLQVRENIGDVIGRPAEWTRVQAGYEGAIDQLDRMGLIDRERIGIQGWSRTGPHMGYMLTHSSYTFAAAAFTDSGDFGWWWYLAAGAPSDIDALFGAAPFGDGLAAWHRYSPTFNLDRVRAPILMWQGRGVVGLWDWYALLRRLQKPVEYWFLPDATHDVFQVGQRIRTSQLLVDWFRFWLKDEEDLSADKRQQYERWRGFRQQMQKE